MSNLYCLVVNGVITYGPGALPKNTKTVSGLNKDPAHAKRLGWLEYKTIIPKHNDKTHKCGDKSREITKDSVIDTFEIVPISDEELKSRDKQHVRSTINRLESQLTLQLVIDALTDVPDPDTGLIGVDRLALIKAQIDTLKKRL